MIFARDLAPKYIGTCCRCGDELLKKNMVALYAKDGSYGALRVTAHFCRKCWVAFLDESGLTEPW